MAYINQVKEKNAANMRAELKEYREQQLVSYNEYQYKQKLLAQRRQAQRKGISLGTNPSQVMNRT